MPHKVSPTVTISRFLGVQQLILWDSRKRGSIRDNMVFFTPFRKFLFVFSEISLFLDGNHPKRRASLLYIPILSLKKCYEETVHSGEQILG